MNNLSPIEAQRAANQRSLAEEKFASARSNLLLMTVLSAINLVLLALGTETMLLFSATVPYFVALISTMMDAAVGDGTAAGLSAVLVEKRSTFWLDDRRAGVFHP